jgi:superfamily II DNA or RNA helicase
MKAKISNNIAIENPSTQIQQWANDNLVITNPDYYAAMKLGRNVRWMPQNIKLYETRGGTIILPFGTLKQVWKFIEKDYTPEFAPNIPASIQGDINLYPYQRQAADAMKRAKSGILQAPCGSGKTQMGLAMIKELNLKALWLTHTTDLLTQSKQRAEQYLQGEFGTITDGEVNIGKDITFATIQTMAKLDLQNYKNEWNVIIVDECHKAVGSPNKVMQFYKVISNLAARHKYGMSATLHRADTMIKSMYALLGDKEYEISELAVGDAITKAAREVILTGIPASTAYLDTDGTMLHQELITYLVESRQRNEMIASKVQANLQNYNLVLTHRVDHCRVLRNLIGSGSIVTGSVTKKERAEIFDKMKTGKEHVMIATYALAKEGLDIPNLDRLHLATPQKDYAIVKQSVGRIERSHAGKGQPIVYDYVDEKIGYCMGMAKKRKRIITE